MNAPTFHSRFMIALIDAKRQGYEALRLELSTADVNMMTLEAGPLFRSADLQTQTYHGLPWVEVGISPTQLVANHGKTFAF